MRGSSRLSDLGSAAHIYNQTDGGLFGAELSWTDGERYTPRSRRRRTPSFKLLSGRLKGTRKEGKKFEPSPVKTASCLDGKANHNSPWRFHSFTDCCDFLSNSRLVTSTLVGTNAPSFKMDKYEDLGLEASKFIEDLNMYEASRDGLFRTRRDAGNNPDFEETRKVFASKMTKIHMQKHQEEMAKNNLAMKMNGGHNNTYYTKDRPPINSYRQPGEAAAKPPILSGPVPGTTAGNQYSQFDGQKHHAGIQSEPPAGRAYGYGNNYDNKERSEPHSYQNNTPTSPSPGNASHSAPTHVRHPTSHSTAWAPSRESQPSPSLSGSGSNSASQQQPQRQASPLSSTNSLPSQQNQAVTPSVNRSPPSSAGSARGWAEEPSGSAKPDLITALPLSAFTGGADFHVQQPSTQSVAHYAPPSSTSRPSSSQNGPVVASSPLPVPSEIHQPKVQVASTIISPGNNSKSFNQGQGQSQIPTCGQAACVEAEVPSSPIPVQMPCQSLLTQPPEQGPSAAEIKLEALTKRLEKEMDAQPKADYFGKTLDYQHQQDHHSKPFQ